MLAQVLSTLPIHTRKIYILNSSPLPSKEAHEPAAGLRGSNFSKEGTTLNVEEWTILSLEGGTIEKDKFVRFGTNSGLFQNLKELDDAPIKSGFHAPV